MGELVKNNEFALGGTSLSKGFGADEFDEAISNAVKANSRQSKWIKKKSFAPSGVGYGSGTCPRYWYYAFNGANFVYDTPAQAIANMDAGTASGERIANMLKNAGMLVRAESTAELQDHLSLVILTLRLSGRAKRLSARLRQPSRKRGTTGRYRESHPVTS